MKDNAKLPDLTPLIAAGINPKTGLPYRINNLHDLKDGLNKVFTEIDKADYIRKGKWNNLPSGLTSELIERILYYRGQAMFFYMSTNDKYYFLPFALDGEINVYGEYLDVTPVAFAGGKTDANKPWISGLNRKVVLDIDDENEDYSNPDKYCVLLFDRARGISQYVESRATLNRPILEAMAEVYPFARTNLLANSGIKGMRVQSEADQIQVQTAAQSVIDAALNGKPWVPIVGTVEFQDLAEGSGLKTEDFLQYYQALDNLRSQTHGYKSAGAMQKKEHVLGQEEEMNAQKSNSIAEDLTTVRKDFCDKVNKLFGLNISYEEVEQDNEDELELESDNSDESTDTGDDSNV